jgi:hypothetical protein
MTFNGNTIGGSPALRTSDRTHQSRYALPHPQILKPEKHQPQTSNPPMDGSAVANLKT